MKTSFTDKNWAKTLVEQHEAKFARCPPPIILGQDNKKLKKSDLGAPALKKNVVFFIVCLLIVFEKSERKHPTKLVLKKN